MESSAAFSAFRKALNTNVMRENCAIGISTSDHLRPTFLTTGNLTQLLATSCPWFSVDTNLHAAKWNLKPDCAGQQEQRFLDPVQANGQSYQTSPSISKSAIDRNRNCSRRRRYILLSVSDRFLADLTLPTNIPSSQGGRRLKRAATPNTLPGRQ